MAIAENRPAHSLGLGGDGDEIAAIADVENRFKVRLDYSNAQSWTTVGDVFAALQRALSAEQAAALDTWERFAEAISMVNGRSAFGKAGGVSCPSFTKPARQLGALIVAVRTGSA